MNKIELCDMFAKQLDQFGIGYKRLNNGFHFQIGKRHNFYPTKRSYFNTDTSERCFYPEFKNADEFENWLSERQLNETMRFSVSAIVDILEDCDHLDDAIQHFKNL